MPLLAAYSSALLPASLATRSQRRASRGMATPTIKIQRTGWKFALMWISPNRIIAISRCGRGRLAPHGKWCTLKAVDGGVFYGDGELCGSGAGRCAHDGDHAV